MASYYEQLVKNNPHAASLVDHVIARQFDLIFQNEKSTLLLRDAFHAVMNGTAVAIINGDTPSRLDTAKVRLVYDFISQQREQLAMPASVGKLEADYSNMLKTLRPVYQQGAAMPQRATLASLPMAPGVSPTQH